VLFVTFTLFRAPLTLLYAMQARVLPALVHLHVAGKRRQLGVWMSRILLIGAVAAPIGYAAGRFVGPWVIGLLYGSAFVPSPVISGAVAAGVVLATASHLAGQVFVATGHTGRLAAAWTAGLVAASATLPYLPGPPGVRVAMAFLAGEVTALATIAATSIRR
jgi:O-antigen/teichoic acid export membrane protein